MKIQEPTRAEMENYLKLARFCLTCDAPECHEFTPEGVDVCANLPFWHGKPVTREILRVWQARLNRAFAD